jgi:hypothetical protein
MRSGVGWHLAPPALLADVEFRSVNFQDHSFGIGTSVASWRGRKDRSKTSRSSSDAPRIGAAMLTSQLFAGDPLLQAIADDLDQPVTEDSPRISRTQHNDVWVPKILQ